MDKVITDRDLVTVEKHISTILHFNLEKEFVKVLDPTFIKLFRLSQLSIQYLQFCKRYLDSTVILLKKELGRVKEVYNYFYFFVCLRLFYCNSVLCFYCYFPKFLYVLKILGVFEVFLIFA